MEIMRSNKAKQEQTEIKWYFQGDTEPKELSYLEKSVLNMF